MSKIIIVLLLFISSLSVAQTRVRPVEWAQPLIGSELDNWYQVDDGLYRSEQPTRNAFSQLAQFGIQEVLNLRQYHSDDAESKDLPLKLHHIKMDTAEITQNEITDALRIILQRSGPMVIHCWHGSDRTGAVVASYRVVVQGWSKSAAIDELVFGGYGYHANFYPNIVELINNLDVEKIRASLGLG